MKKILKYTVLTLLIIILSATIYVYIKAPDLAPQDLSIIDEVIKNELPESILGEHGFITNDNISIWYERRDTEGEPKGVFILHMGLASDALGWPEYFMNALVDSGYQIVRYDQRGTGLSDWIKDWKGKGAYSLSDMATDVIAIQDHLGIDDAFHFGISLGGMVAQEIAIEYPLRCLGLISMMSSAHIEDPELPSMNMDIIKKMALAYLRYGLIPSEKGIIKMHVAIRKMLQGNPQTKIDVKGTAESVLYNVRKRKGFNPEAAQQHSQAVRNTGSRLKSLETLKVPALIIHGSSDPLIPVVHGIKSGEKIPVARLRVIEGLGHDLPEKYVEEVINELITFADKNGEHLMIRK